MKLFSFKTKTYEGRITIKWHKNDYGDLRPLTIDCDNEKELNRELKRIRKAFFTEKGLDGYDYPDYLFRNEYGEKTTEIPKPYSVTFDMNERI